MSDEEQQDQQETATPDYGQSDQVAKPQGDRCPRCGDKAYHAESIAMEGYKFHKRCFACKDCKKKLDSTNAASHDVIMSDEEQQDQQESATPDYGESDQVAKPSGDRCPRCGDKAYHAESISMEGYKFHKRCFSCKECKKKLDSTNAASHGGKSTCIVCYKLFLIISS
ncbi:hypothetical protein QZH41_012702 [Actinostola sp. cb2023]|nr:hypothetical protein QZH41_012702 [Actinostola sp. cb2023]